mmetsp:Transcript_12234/g.22696  ORF Transcript_12234/g.22696 Transcript_12234/m.22696 type:complete len:393 (+) Transcript_12234:1704-2882(+)
MEQVAELVEFLGSTRADVRKAAVSHVLSLTGSDGGVLLLHTTDGGDVCKLLGKLLTDGGEVATMAANALTNMSTNERVRDEMVEKDSIWKPLLEVVNKLQFIKRDAAFPEDCQAAIKLVTNLTTSVAGSHKILLGRLGEEHMGHDVRILLDTFARRPDELPECGMILTNVTRLEEGRKVVADPTRPYLEQLSRLISTSNPVIRRAALDTIRNCCFEEDVHRHILKRTTAAERAMVLLLGPEGVSDPEEYDELPSIVKTAIEEAAQEDKELQIEPDALMRRSIVDMFNMLTLTRAGRERLREKNVYTVLKAYHPLETVEETHEEVFKLVDMLLGEEEGPTILSESEGEGENENENENENEVSSVKEKKSVADADCKDAPAADGEEASILFEVD